LHTRIERIERWTQIDRVVGTERRLDTRRHR
jgi:hypothetical protein